MYKFRFFRSLDLNFHKSHKLSGKLDTGLFLIGQILSKRGLQSLSDVF